MVQIDTLGDGTIGRMNLKLIPFLMVLYLIAYIDRSNISVAALQMNAELGLTTKMYGIGAGLFYVTYVLLEVPSNLILSRVGARRWIARIMFSWGLIAAGMSLVHTPMQFTSCGCCLARPRRASRRASSITCPAGIRAATARAPCRSSTSAPRWPR